MPGSSLELKGVRIFAVPEQGPQLRSDRDAVDLISAASEHRAALILIPVQRLGDDFSICALTLQARSLRSSRCMVHVSRLSEIFRKGLAKANPWQPSSLSRTEAITSGLWKPWSN